MEYSEYNFLSRHKSISKSWNWFAIVVRIWIDIDRWLRQQRNSSFFFSDKGEGDFVKMCTEINSKSAYDENEQYQCQCQSNTTPKFSNRERNIQQGENISKLPEEILQYIFSYLTRESLMEAVLVCRHWNEVVIIAEI